MNLTKQEREQLLVTHQNIERVLEISRAITKLEKAISSNICGSEGLRNVMHDAAVLLEPEPIKEIVALIRSKLEESKNKLELEISGLRGKLEI